MRIPQMQSGQTFIRPLGRNTVERFAYSQSDANSQRVSRLAGSLHMLLGLLTRFLLLSHGFLLLSDQSGGETRDWILANQIPFGEMPSSPRSPHSVFISEPQLALRKKMLRNPYFNRYSCRRNSEQSFRESVDIDAPRSRLPHRISQSQQQ